MKINHPIIAPESTINNIIVPTTNNKMPKFWQTNSPAASQKNVPKSMEDIDVITALDSPIKDVQVITSVAVVDCFSTGSSKVQRMPSIVEDGNPLDETIKIPSSWAHPATSSSTPTPSPPPSKENNRNPGRPQSSRRFLSTSFDASAEHQRTIRQQVTNNDMMLHASDVSSLDPRETSSVKNTWKNTHSLEFEEERPALTTDYHAKPPTTRHSPKQPSGRSKRSLAIPTYRVMHKSSKDFNALSSEEGVRTSSLDVSTSKGRTSFMLESVTKAFDWFFHPTKPNRLLLQQ